MCVSSVKGDVGTLDSTDHSPVVSTVKSPYLPLTPDTSSDVSSPVSVSAADMQPRGSSVGSLPSVGVSDRHRAPSSHGHTRHHSVDFVLADIVPDLSETIDTDFVHAARSHVRVCLPFTFMDRALILLGLAVFHVAWWLSDRVLDLPFIGCGLNSRPVRFHVT